MMNAKNGHGSVILLTVQKDKEPLLCFETSEESVFIPFLVSDRRKNIPTLFISVETYPGQKEGFGVRAGVFNMGNMVL